MIDKEKEDDIIRYLLTFHRTIACFCTMEPTNFISTNQRVKWGWGRRARVWREHLVQSSAFKSRKRHRQTYRFTRWWWKWTALCRRWYAHTHPLTLVLLEQRLNNSCPFILTIAEAVPLTSGSPPREGGNTSPAPSPRLATSAGSGVSVASSSSATSNSHLRSRKPGFGILFGRKRDTGGKTAKEGKDKERTPKEN